MNLSSNLQSIGNSAFWGCAGITSLAIPETVSSIGTSAFYNCSEITSLILYLGVGDIGESAFYGCSKLTSLTIPGSVEAIGENAFRNCTGIGNIMLQQGLFSIGDYAFYGCIGLTTATIPQSVISIGANTFSSCPNLSSLTWYYNQNYSATDLNIRNYLTNVVINSNIIAIGDNAFWNCTNLLSITIPTSVESIGAYAFCLLDSLSQILIPSSVTIIGAYAFSACSSLEIFSEASSKPSGWAVNWNAQYRPVYYYSAVSKVNCWHYVNNIPTIWYVEGTQGLEYILVDGTFSVIGINAINLTTLVIPSTYSGLPVTKVGNGSVALTNSYFLQTIVINEGIDSIEAKAFSGCSWLSSITIPNGVTSIGAYAFQNCTYLTTIGFGYNGSTYYWTGAVQMSILGHVGYRNTNNGVFLFVGNSILTFSVRTLTSKNAWSKINGSLSFSGVYTHTSTVRVSITNSVTINNGSFSINTANLANGTYTLTMYSSFTRASWSGSSTHTFTFIVDK